jgi:hypothetical protein
MRTIKLTQKQVTQVDDEDYEYLSQFKWCAIWCIDAFYAGRSAPRLFGHGRIWMHRVIMNTPDGVETDHKDGNALNNQRSNLRICTHSQNCHNRKKRADNTSGYKGVFTTKGKKWRAQIRVNGKSIHIDVFSTREEAAHAYDEAAKKYHGEFADLNFP